MARNPAGLKHYSPLRYPGGKQKLAKFIASVCDSNGVSGHYVEPYAGGASVALYLLMGGHVEEVTINDKDKSIHAFWHTVLYDTERLCDRIRRVKLSVPTWRQQRNIQLNKENEDDIFKLGFSTLFLNRTNYSGVLNGGVIGGLGQTGEYKMDCRFNRIDLIDRIRRISEYKNEIHLENLDALKLMQKVKKNKNTLFYFDPPYYIKGQCLYLNSYEHKDHKAVSEEIKKLPNAHWIVSYDNVKEINRLYREYRKINYSFNHSVRSPRSGKEVVFFSKGLKYPSVKDPVRMI